ncbi:hypothetical protein CYMTET_8061 [Cymbomonas tetramitiformis]|uniref:Uncharacterized protein n=1 Tax=Cymbomonas tetramitiformis TaxID=36881 RepID=A0AAE0GUF4_9CHLO|nr:hypothetical protein CYMTET_8061 [Cymbomonas tetramitiformis]
MAVQDATSTFGWSASAIAVVPAAVASATETTFPTTTFTSSALATTTLPPPPSPHRHHLHRHHHPHLLTSPLPFAATALATTAVTPAAHTSAAITSATASTPATTVAQTANAGPTSQSTSAVSVHASTAFPTTPITASAPAFAATQPPTFASATSISTAITLRPRRVRHRHPHHLLRPLHRRLLRFMDYTPLSYPFEQYQPFSDLTSAGKYVAELQWTPTSDDVERVLGGCPAPPIQEVWRLQVFVPEYSDIFSIRLGDTDVLIVELNDPYDAVASQCTTRGVYGGQTLRESLGWDANAFIVPALFCRACNLGRDPNSVRDNPHGIDVTLVSDSCWAITPVDDRDNRHPYQGCSTSNFQGRGFYYSGYADKKLCHWPTSLDSVSFWP